MAHKEGVLNGRSSFLACFASGTIDPSCTFRTHLFGNDIVGHLVIIQMSFFPTGQGWLSEKSPCGCRGQRYVLFKNLILILLFRTYLCGPVWVLVVLSKSLFQHSCEMFARGIGCLRVCMCTPAVPASSFLTAGLPWKPSVCVGTVAMQQPFFYFSCSMSKSAVFRLTNLYVCVPCACVCVHVW